MTYPVRFWTPPCGVGCLLKFLLVWVAKLQWIELDLVDVFVRRRALPVQYQCILCDFFPSRFQHVISFYGRQQLDISVGR